MSIPDACLLSHTYLFSSSPQLLRSKSRISLSHAQQLANLYKEHQEIIFASQCQKYTAEIYAYKMKDSIFITSFVNNIPCNEQ